ncbi:MAG: sulfite exporter TauE/SafE family protein [Planctomycetes bacterium]|nr:sulfite exporter TauE/SafE family protein [Planctomycetota bacterium]
MALEIPRRIAAVALIALAAAGLGAWAFRSFSPAPLAARPAETGLRSVVYYLHGTLRCSTCNGIEKSAARACSEYEPASGRARPEFRVENFEKAGNEHFSRDFGVLSSSVLLAEVDGGRIVRAQLCPRIWDLSEEESAMTDYLKDEFRSFFSKGGNSGTPPATVGTEGASRTRLLGGWLALFTALGLGLLTAISPCPLATNIAAISFLARRAATPAQALLGGLAYALGRTLAYVVIGAVLAGGLLSIPATATFLARHVNALLGPLLILVAVLLLRLVEVPWSLGAGGGATVQKWAKRGGVLASFGIGALFALAFCPTSAALFFGALVPLAINEGRPLSLAVAYGLGTAVPVLIFAVLVVGAARTAGRIFSRLSDLERWLRWSTGAVFLAVGLYYTIRVDLFPSG